MVLRNGSLSRLRQPPLIFKGISKGTYYYIHMEMGKLRNREVKLVKIFTQLGSSRGGISIQAN